MRRGQATVELVLGVLVLVPMLLIGIYMAEYAQLSLKVQDAATFAVWDGSGARVQQFPSGDRSPFSATVENGDPRGGVAARARQRFRGFDPTLDGPPATVTRARTRGEALDVDCVRENVGPQPSQWGPPGELPAIERVYRGDGAYSCASSASISAIEIPTQFMMRNEGGFFRRPVLERTSMHVCGLGFPTGQSCTGRLLVLSNDWGLSGSETNECDVNCRAGPYYKMVEDEFAAAFADGPAFASAYAGGAPVKPFQFSYVSVEHQMKQPIVSEGEPEFITGGAGIASPSATGTKCFLGMPCPH